jgi:uncharacterized protein (DUF952 family)
VANAYYRSVPGALVVLELDEAKLGSVVRWEPPAHPDGRPAKGDEPLFPHVFGPIRVAAVVSVRSVVRDSEGAFIGYGDPEPRPRPAS